MPRHPDPHFMRKLKQYDPEVKVWFNRVLALWQLFRAGKVIMTVREPDGTFRPLDDRVLTTLRRGNFYIRGRAVYDEIEQANLNAQAAIDADWRDFLTYNHRELQKQFRKATDDIVGAINVPKEDLAIPDKPTLERRRKRRMANTDVNYGRKPMPAIVVD